MASRLSALRRPAVAAATVALVGVGGTAIALGTSKKHTISMPIADIKRDASTGRIIPPKFPDLKPREQQLADLRRSGDANEEEYDLVIIGGGATGTGIAVDAITRGLKVALVERDDFSSGTSSKSTKLVHGGVRYLEKAVTTLDYPQLELVIEALRERRTFLNIAPHLSSSLPILLPLQKYWQVPYMWAGTKTYDLLAGSQGLESSYYVSKSKALEQFPLLRKQNLIGALVYYDGQHNDSRMNVSLAITAALYGATVLNHVEVTDLEKDAQGKIRGVKVKDVLGAQDSPAFSVRAKGVINATGPFADAVEQMDDKKRKPIVAPASGAHVMLPGKLCPNGMGLLDAATSDGRVVFVLPWQGKTLAGTTDNACEVEHEPVALQKDVDFILKEVNKLFVPDAALTNDDVLASWSGIRPLVKDPNAKNTESLVRSHLVTVSPSGLLTCAGGKWTTYRQMAEDAVDEAIKTFNLTPKPVTLPDISGAMPPLETTGQCCTLTTPLVGAHGFSPDLASQIAAHHSIDLDIAQHLASNYGDRAWAVLSTQGATSRLLPAFPFVEAEIRHGVHHESACTAADLIARRTRLAFLDVGSALSVLPRVIDVMGEELSWDEKRKEHEWKATVLFFRSMGLPEDQLNVTRNDVLKGNVARKIERGAEKAVATVSGSIPNFDGQTLSAKTKA
ncbi:glycerol-3-phosphate dehydrogenase [Emericellopsis atlantica]|uniref:Glycerol-3-phosphate dehydrogenase n=1 Tax=Emericellopsis atlantica TaxID=2614577 RepID=A0A9P8CTF7_9HYPO|nr:glycerol-3-phosphate dehydrogenase [Emericellopsis atlantica]KAG9256771.1 glycerol-3-phosphate dehydrogenase [Emericellopsis atlantica]